MERIPNSSTPCRSASRKGVALVIVLCLLVLISGIVVAFFSSVSSEYLTAKSASSGSNAKELADSTVQLVMGQIRQATSQGSNICWASQPGMIRTWGDPDGGASYKKLALYKLYSSSSMIVNGSNGIDTFSPDDDYPASAAWEQQPALYTDLNEPVIGSTGTNYPIIDPRVQEFVSGTYPLVDGFSVDISKAPVKDRSVTSGTAPMPVKWLYVLRNGTMIAPDPASTGTVVQFTQAYVNLGYSASDIAKNPIVGRVAFWTDDETCKLNLNTACGGVYWEQPMFTTDMDVAFSRYKPVAGEFNRFRGHPATTSLMPVFWSFAGLENPSANLFPEMLPTTTHKTFFDVMPSFSTTGSTAFTNLMKLVPRNSLGGSQMGTVATGGAGVTTGSSPVVLDADRLYASIDEALFGNPNRGDASAINAFGDSSHPLDSATLKKLRFFLTTTSRAPETNPFNLPKVGIWPVPLKTGTDYRSPADRLIAFCSTLGKNGSYPYYFTRNNAQSATEDWPVGGRNDQLFDFLDRGMGNNIPGFGRSFKDRYTVEGNRHILANIYDYIRSTINILDTSFGSTAPDGNGNKNFYNTFLGPLANYSSLGFGQVVPIKIRKDSADYKGMGRFPLIKEVAVMFMARASNQPPLSCGEDGKPFIHAATSATTTNLKFYDEQGKWTNEGFDLVIKGEVLAKTNPRHLWTMADQSAMTGNRPGMDPIDIDVPQLTSISKIDDGNKYYLPVLAVQAGAIQTIGEKKVVTDINSLFPIFGTFVRDVNDLSTDAEVKSSGVMTWRKDSLGMNVATVSPYSKITTNSGLKILYVQPKVNHPGDIMYPSLIGRDGKNGRFGIVEGDVVELRMTGTDNVTKTYKFIQAKYSFDCDPDNPNDTQSSALTNKPQTHAGMPYLTTPSINTGAYTCQNRRYQEGELPLRSLLKPGMTEMQAVFLVDPVNVACGVTPMLPKFMVSVAGLDSFVATSPGTGGPLKFPSLAKQTSLRPQGSSSPFYNLGMSLISLGLKDNLGVRNTKGNDDQTKLTFIGQPVTVSGTTFTFNGGTITLKTYATPPSTGASPTSSDLKNQFSATENDLVQTYTIDFPNDPAFPTPALPHMPLNQAGAQFNNTLFDGPKNSDDGKYLVYNANNDNGLYGPMYPTLSSFFWKKNTSLQGGGTIDINNDEVRFPPGVPSRIADLTPSCLLTSDTANVLSSKPNEGVGDMVLYTTSNSGVDFKKNGGYKYKEGQTHFFYSTGNDTAMLQYFLPEQNGYPNTNFRTKLTCDTIRAVECLYGDPRIFGGLTNVTSGFFKPHRYYHNPNMRAAHTFRGAQFGDYPESYKNTSSNFRGATDHSLSDAVLLMVSGTSWNYNVWTDAGGNGDLQSGRRPGNDLTGWDREISRLGGHSTNSSQNGLLRNFGPYITSSCEFDDAVFNSNWSGITKFSEIWNKGGDFSNGIGSDPDGPYINKPNEAGGFGSTKLGATIPLYPDWWSSSGSVMFTTETQFTPNRLISSPVAFGCLPSGFKPENAWQTLLFCPNPNASSPSVYSNIRMKDTEMVLANKLPDRAACPDHILLDFFTMPVVEPYAISEPFSTGGKVNMNYQIVPFTYINRDTALRGVFRDTLITAVQDSVLPPPSSGGYFHKSCLHGADPDIIYGTSTDSFGKFLDSTEGWGFRYPIHAEETLKQFQWRFDNGEIFRSPSEICSLFLYPATQPKKDNQSLPRTALISWNSTNSNILQWWYDGAGTSRKSLTGDNERERPYDAIYPRLTTKSNSYTVHFRVQVLKQDTSDPAKMTTWVETPARIVSEYRGSTLVERYVDPNDPSMPDFATTTNDTLDNYYKFRVVNTKKFTAE